MPAGLVSHKPGSSHLPPDLRLRLADGADRAMPPRSQSDSLGSPPQHQGSSAASPGTAEFGTHDTETGGGTDAGSAVPRRRTPSARRAGAEDGVRHGTGKKKPKQGPRSRSPLPPQHPHVTPPAGSGGKGAARGAARPKRKPSELEQAKQHAADCQHQLHRAHVRMEDLEQEVERQINLARDREEEAAEAAREAAEEHAEQLRAAKEEAARDKEDALQEKEDELEQLRREMNAAVAIVEGERDKARKLAADREAEIRRNDAAHENRMLQLREEMEERIASHQRTIDSLTADLHSAEGTLRRTQQHLTDVEQQRDERYSRYESYMREGEEMRTELHNRLIELKGNIRVFARVRPLLKSESRLSDKQHYEFPEGCDHKTVNVVDVPGHQSVVTGQSEPSQVLPFSFDRVFGPDTAQQAVFDEISQLVQSALDGYKVCIFAYGQTGSGKTFTMEGPSPGAASESSGMIPRAVEQIFESCQRKSERSGFKFRLLCTFIEIYNEHVQDLLNPQEFYKIGSSDLVTHDIRHQDGETIVTGAAEVEVAAPGQVYQLLRIAADSRKTAETRMNDRASRSHSVFTMKILGRNEATQQTIRGVLNLIDLAGSERLKKSGATGDRLRETQHINKSLSTLGDVIHALARGDSHVPFRSSKLTYLLQPSMSNESKTLMFVNVNPYTDHLGESINSLRFASRVNSCEIGIARRRVGSFKDPAGVTPAAAASPPAAAPAGKQQARVASGARLRSGSSAGRPKR
eukprot:TRINITY_DN2210_c1_g1_i1.p1 TRINITY_DN2210_c1_g1~~TRINITY_DN2210_c1_g1_i1.p1  ORF type:complete len:775 (+),score=266.20 TRINITY_DN2210_c1_g1_i1:83-2326(+)